MSSAWVDEVDRLRAENRQLRTAIDDLLCTTELNLDEMERSTVDTIERVRTIIGENNETL